MNTNEIARLAAAVNNLRPGWPTVSLQTFIADNLAQRTYRDAAVALAYVACDPDSRTPKRVLEAGPWWQTGEVRMDVGTRIAIKDRCSKCHHLHAPDAPCVDRGRASPKADEMRALLASTRSNLCPCGVKPALCAEHRPAPEKP